MEKETTYGLSPEQLARLLAMGLNQEDDRQSGEDSSTRADVLEEMLTSELSLDPAVPRSLPAVLKRPCEELPGVTGRTLGQLLLNPQCDLGIIRTLKDYGKAMSRARAPEAEQAAAVIIYYAAIASALLFHGQRITQHSWGKLHAAYAQLNRKPWITPELKELFQKARVLCQQKMDKST